MAIDKYLKNIRKYVPMTRAEEEKWFHKAKAGDRQAYEHIIQSNLRFVVSVAKQYQNQGLPLEELIAEGNLGLIRAYEKFDIEKKYKFITYAVWWIRQAIITSLHENSKLVRIPLNKFVNITKVNKLKEQLEQECARALNFDELIEHLEDPKALQDLKYNYLQIDIDRPTAGSNKDLNEIIPDVDAVIHESLELVREELDDVLSEFTEREQEIIYMYFGIGHPRHYTLHEIGIDLGLTRERIRQIKERVIEKLQKKKRADKLRTYLN